MENTKFHMLRMKSVSGEDISADSFAIECQTLKDKTKKKKKKGDPHDDDPTDPPPAPMLKMTEDESDAMRTLKQVREIS